MSELEHRPEFRMLGPLELVRDGEVFPLGGTKPGEVLAVLLLHLNQPVSTEVLIDALWGESLPATARKSLQTHIWQLRQALEPGDQPSVLVTQGSSYKLNASPDQVDALVFESLLKEAQVMADAGDHLGARDRLDEALRLWRGPALADFRYEDFTQPEIRRLEDLRSRALEERVEADLKLGRHADLVEELRSAVAEQPLRERLWELLAWALCRSGRMTEALRACGEAAEVLDRELGASPGPRLRELQERIDRKDPALEWQPQEPTITSPARALVGTARPFVGRDGELARLSAVFDDAYGGRGWAVTVSGEPGIGKTRLLRELEPYVQMRGGRMLWGRPHRDVGTPAYWPMAEILSAHLATLDDRRRRAMGPQPSVLADLIPEAGEILDLSAERQARADPKEAQLRLFQAVGSYLVQASASEPLVLVIDDLQWADESTLQLLRHLASHIEDARLLLVGAFRSLESDEGHPVEGALADLERAVRYQSISLQQLPTNAVAQYLDTVLSGMTSPDPEMVHQATGGNPFYLVELVSLLGHDEGDLGDAAVSPSLLTVVRRRLSLLSGEAGRALDTAAVIGPDFEASLVASLIDMPEDRVLDLLEEAAGAGLLDQGEAEGEFSFGHDLIRDAIVADLSASERLRLHARIAHVLEESTVGQPESVAPRLAFHFARSGRPGHLERAIHYETLAGEQAARVAGWEQARDHYQRALRLLDRLGRDDPAIRADLHLRLSSCRRLSGDIAGAGKDLFEAFELYRRAENPSGMARVVIEGLSDEVFIEADRAIALTDQALAANRDAAPELRARLLARRAWEPLGYDEASNRAAQEAIELASRHGLGEIEAMMHDRETHRVLHAGRFSEARELARAGFQAAHRVHNHELASHTLAEIMGSHNMDGDVDAALHAAHRVIDYGEEHGALFWTQVARIVAARIHILRAEPELMEGLIKSVPEQVFLSPLLVRATWAELTGEFDEAGTLAGRAVEALPLHRMAAFVRGIYLGLHARISLRRGDEEAARFAFAGWREAIGESFGQYRAAAVGEIDEALSTLGEPDLIREIYEELISHDARATFPARPLDYMRGYLASALDLPDRAEKHFRTGVHWAEKIRSPLEAGRNLIGLALIAEMRDDSPEELLSRATELLASSGATGYLEQPQTN